jgi:hypothetical protein
MFGPHTYGNLDGTSTAGLLVGATEHGARAQVWLSLLVVGAYGLAFYLPTRRLCAIWLHHTPRASKSIYSGQTNGAAPCTPGTATQWVGPHVLRLP